MNRKHFLIVGGTKGIGFSLAQLLAAQGQIVSAIGRKIPIKSDARIHYWPVDIADSKKLTRTLAQITKRFGRLSGLAFFQRYRGDKDSWSGEIETSLTATKSIIEAVASHLDSKNGSIVLVSSINSHLITKTLPLGYHVAKSGLVQIARYYAVLLGPKGIRVNCVSPGTIVKEESRNFYSKNKTLNKFYRSAAPLRRMGEANEIAEIVSFLLSPKSSFITGQEIIADGGISLQWQESLAAAKDK